MRNNKRYERCNFITYTKLYFLQKVISLVSNQETILIFHNKIKNVSLVGTKTKKQFFNNIQNYTALERKKINLPSKNKYLLIRELIEN